MTPLDIAAPRTIDELGRIVIPASIRRILGLERGDHLDVRLEGDRIVVTKVPPACVFCNGGVDLLQLSGKRLCRPCLQDVNRSAAVTA